MVERCAVIERDMVPLVDIGEDDFAGKQHPGRLEDAVTLIILV
jgi:hypothetical protein